VRGNRSAGFFLNNCSSDGTIRDANEGEGPGRLTLRIRSAASDDTESGMRRSTLQILRYVATMGVRQGRGLEVEVLTVLTTQVFKGRFSDQELKGQDAESPIIYLLRMFPPLDHFWGKIVQCPAHGFPPIRGRMNAPPKVSDLEFTIDPDEEILGFNVSVNYVFGVEVDESVGHLVNVNSTSAFREAAILHELFVHLALASEF